MAASAHAAAAGVFSAALRDAHEHLANAHLAALGTLEAELQHIRGENTRLRAQLAELQNASPKAAAPSAVIGLKADAAQSVPAGADAAPQAAPQAAEPVRPVKELPGSGEVGYLPVPALHELARPDGATAGQLPSAAEAPEQADRDAVQVSPRKLAVKMVTPAGSLEGRVTAMGGLEAKAYQNTTLPAPVQDVAPPPPTDLVPGDQTAEGAPAAGAVEEAVPAASAGASEPASAAPAGSGHAASPSTTPVGSGHVASPSASLASSQRASVADMGLAIEATLARFGWQHIDVQRQSANVWVISGTVMHIRFDSSPTQTSGPSGAGLYLLASEDGGRAWEQLDALIRRRRLHKVVRTVPIAASTMEFAVDPQSPEKSDFQEAPVTSGPRPQPPPPPSGAGARQGPGSMLKQVAGQAPLSLAELASMPVELAGVPSRRGAAPFHQDLREDVGGRDPREDLASRTFVPCVTLRR